MFGTAHIALIWFFYPIGNTPPANLLRHHPPPSKEDEEETIRLLLLACGDPRNLLYTLWSQDVGKRTFDFTCCDYEPAILARNVILLTLMVNNASRKEVSKSVLWKIFYDLYIPEDALALLQSHASLLVTASESVETWQKSGFNYISSSDRHTLNTVRNFWEKYSKMKNHSKKELKVFTNRVRSQLKAIYSERIGEGAITRGIRSAGPLYFSAAAALSEAFAKYWATGVTGGNKNDVQALGDGIANPMFVFSSAGEDSAIHYGTDPLESFHLASAFKFSEKGSQDLASKISKAVAVAKTQFNEWCTTFTQHVQRDSVKICFTCADATAFCYVLQSRGMPPNNIFSHVYGKPWSSRQLFLEDTLGRVPDQFNIIDTSNVADHIGMLNLLNAVVPLLERSPTSALYTESLLVASEDAKSTLSALMGADVTTLCLIYGIAPVGQIAGLSTYCDGNEKVDALTRPKLKTKIASRQHHMRITWKMPELGDALFKQELGTNILEADPKDLADFFFTVYENMFAHEDITAMMALTTRKLTAPVSIDGQHYTRAGFAALLRIAQSRFPVNWKRTISLTLERIFSDRKRLIGNNSYQDLYLHLHLLGVFSSDALLRSPQQVVREEYGFVRNEPGLLGRPDVPPVIHATLVIPRNKLSMFTRMNKLELGTPNLHVTVRQVASMPFFDNTFSSIQCSFGKVIRTDDQLSIEEDPLGWTGTADLIVVFKVPSFNLLQGARDGIKIGLSITSAPETVRFVQTLGPRLIIYDGSLSDKKSVFLSINPPGFPTSSSPLVPSPSFVLPQGEKGIQSVTVKLDANSKCTGLQMHVDFAQDTLESKLLAGGEAVSTLQLSACTLQLTIGTKACQLHYPYPIDGSVTKVRIARKSRWIEVMAPISAALDKGGYSLNHFPFVPLPNNDLANWNIPYIPLEKLPKIPLTKTEDFSWVNTLAGLTLTDHERILNHSTTDTKPPRLELKETLNELFLSSCGRGPHHPGFHRRIQLVFSHNKSSDTLFVVHGLRHDLESLSIVVDACVVPLTKPRCESFAQALSHWFQLDSISLSISKEEGVLWKQLLPVLAERCRKWSHGTNCEYRISSKIPLSTEANVNPLCTCGEGKDIPKELFEKDLAALSKIATRVAIPLLFSVPFAERNSEPAPSEICAHCAKVGGKLMKCGQCSKAWYCGRDCQKAAWKRHKIVCKLDRELEE